MRKLVAILVITAFVSSLTLAQAKVEKKPEPAKAKIEKVEKKAEPTVEKKAEPKQPKAKKAAKKVTEPAPEKK
jgi:hypothetical protein